jgi:SPP1 family predicted phage head-tail adaptor
MRYRINPGELRHRITFQLQDLDSEDEDWKDIATTWANINPISGKEYYSAETINSDLTHKIRLRYRKGITPDMRVIYNDRIFYIISVINEYEKNTMLQLMCRELI